MKTKNINIGHVYYVDYEPVRNGEFNGLHLSIVLKKNDDKFTYIVMPLTSSAKGEGVNKVNIGKIAGLPSNIKNNDSYAVYNQVRTVNASRFRAVKSGGLSKHIKVDSGILSTLHRFLIRDTLFDVSQNEKISIFKNLYEEERFNKAKNIAYNIIRLRTKGSDEEKISVLKSEIRGTLISADYILDAQQIEDCVQKVFDEALKT